MQWLEEFRASADREFGESRWMAILATVDRAGAPHARCVFCQRTDEEGRLFMATDARTQKNEEVRGERRAELVFWMTKLKVQYRISGEIQIVAFPEDEGLRKEIWRQLSDENRAIYFWPTPGIAAGSDDAFAQAVSADVAPPRTFEVMIFEPRLVDRLSLDSRPFRRRVWRADAKWAGVDVNP